MCGILAILGSPCDHHLLLSKALKLSKLIRHRGPDWNGVHSQRRKRDGGSDVLAHERLAIVGVRSGHQPLFNGDRTVCASVNGEIYNHLSLRKLLSPDILAQFESESDCQVIPYLYREQKEKFVSLLDGMFAFVIADGTTNEFMAARDPIGICPLYVGYDTQGAIWFASEMKCIVHDCTSVGLFPPGHVYLSWLNGGRGGFQRYYNPTWWSIEAPLPTNPLSLDALRGALERSVDKRLMSEVPFGVLLSGGLDSSLIAAIAQRSFMERQRKEAGGCHEGWFSKLHSFSIGLKHSPDLKAARIVADFLGTSHYEFTFEIQEGIDALKDVIYHLETYDVTTIRAATPMYFLSRLIKSLGVKMVLSGEGADEIFGGYLYFHKAPNKTELHKETVRKIHALHQYDVLRANKATMAFGVEVRVPFLDKEFLDIAMSVDSQEKMCVPGKRPEKWMLRAAFDGAAYLPHDILWRQKEQFSDGVGYGWIDGIRDHAEKAVSELQMSRAKMLFPLNTPLTKEAYMYRCWFQEAFPLNSAAETVPWGPSIACSSAVAIEWDKSFRRNADQSGRAVLGVHADATTFTEAAGC